MFDQEQAIEQILNTARVIAVVGLSRRINRPGYYVPAYMHDHGYRIIPVNPYLTEALGQQAYPDLASIPEPVDLVLLFQRSEKVPPFVEQAIAIGAKAIWMQMGIYHEQAAQLAEEAGLAVVMDTCIMVEHRRRK